MLAVYFSPYLMKNSTQNKNFNIKMKFIRIYGSDMTVQGVPEIYFLEKLVKITLKKKKKHPLKVSGNVPEDMQQMTKYLLQEIN